MAFRPGTPDSTVQAFASYLTVLRGRIGTSVRQMLNDMSVIRDGIVAHNADLTELKCQSSHVFQHMRSQLTEVRITLTDAFSEITALVKQKTQSDRELLENLHSLQHNISYNKTDVSALKSSYSSTHVLLQHDLIQLQNNLRVIGTALEYTRSHVDQVHGDCERRFSGINQACKRIEEQIAAETRERNVDLLQIQQEITRVRETVSVITDEIDEHKRETQAAHAQLQVQLDECKRRQRASPRFETPPKVCRPPANVAISMTSCGARSVGAPGRLTPSVANTATPTPSALRVGRPTFTPIGGVPQIGYRGGRRPVLAQQRPVAPRTWNCAMMPQSARSGLVRSVPRTWTPAVHSGNVAQWQVPNMAVANTAQVTGNTQRNIRYLGVRGVRCPPRPVHLVTTRNVLQSHLPGQVHQPQDWNKAHGKKSSSASTCV